MSERADTLKDDNVRLVQEISTAEANEKALKEQLISARADVAASKGEVAFLKSELAAAQAREEDLATSQGEVMRALAERNFCCGEFSTLAGALNDVMATRKVAATLDKVVKDHPDLNKEK